MTRKASGGSAVSAGLLDPITVPPLSPIAIGLALADALNHERPLTPDESEMVAALLHRAPSPRPLRRWTAAHDAFLRELLALGHTAAEIGAQIGRSTDAIHTRVKRLKMKERQ